MSFCFAGGSGSDGTATQKESAGRPSAAERSGFDHPGRGVRVEFCQEGGNAKGGRRKRTAPSQPTALPSQSAHEGTCHRNNTIMHTSRSAIAVGESLL